MHTHIQICMHACSHKGGCALNTLRRFEENKTEKDKSEMSKSEENKRGMSKSEEDKFGMSKSGKNQIES